MLLNQAYPVCYCYASGEASLMVCVVVLKVCEASFSVKAAKVSISSSRAAFKIRTTILQVHARSYSIELMEQAGTAACRSATKSVLIGRNGHAVMAYVRYSCLLLLRSSGYGYSVCSHETQDLLDVETYNEFVISAKWRRVGNRDTMNPRKTIDA